MCNNIKQFQAELTWQCSHCVLWHNSLLDPEKKYTQTNINLLTITLSIWSWFILQRYSAFFFFTLFVFMGLGPVQKSIKQTKEAGR